MPKLIALLLIILAVNIVAPVKAEYYAFDESPVFDDKDASANYNFKLAVMEMAQDASGTCRVQVDVYPKGEPGTVLQQLNVEMLLQLDGEKPVSYNNNIICMDINFDGNEDLAVYSGNLSAYGGPSYNFYLYNPDKRCFERSEVLEELQMGGLGMFEVDSAREVIIVYSKSGCCIHAREEFRVVNNVPEPVYFKEEALSMSGEFLEYQERRLINGKWEERFWSEPVPDNW